MVKIKGEFLEEVTPAFKKQIKLLLKEASLKVIEAEKLIMEAEKLSTVIDSDVPFRETLNKAVFRKSLKFFKRKDEACSDKESVLEIPHDVVAYTPLESEKPVNLVSGQSLSKKKAKQKRLPGHKKYRGKRTIVEYKGVTFVDDRAEGSQYRARVSIKKKPYEIGFFATALEAAYAYDEFKYKRTKKVRGMNFPERIEIRLRKSAKDIKA
jgi:hypothetical protein